MPKQDVVNDATIACRLPTATSELFKDSAESMGFTVSEMMRLLAGWFLRSRQSPLHTDLDIKDLLNRLAKMD